MFGFLIKKTCYDLWDNLPRVVLLNLGFYGSAAFPLLLPAALEAHPPLAWASGVAGLLWCCIYLAAAERCVRRVSDYGSFGAADFFHNLKPALLPGLVLAFLTAAGIFVLTAAIPFYGSWEARPGIFIAALLFWSLAAALFALQFYPAASVRLDGHPLKAVKRCLFFFMDNTPFCILSCLLCACALPLSALLGFLAPGPAGILLFLDEGLRLRLLKYADPVGGAVNETVSLKHKKIPWEVLLMEEREKTGTRSLRGFIFPWKE